MDVHVTSFTTLTVSRCVFVRSFHLKGFRWRVENENWSSREINFSLCRPSHYNPLS